MKAINFIARIPKDKLLHFLGGLLIFILIYIGIRPFFDGCLGRGIAFFLVLLVGLVKEYVIDKHYGGSVDIWDVHASDFGAIVGIIISLIL